MSTSALAIARSRRAAVNRRNARHSTGPRTPSGKAASRLNALEHGVYAREAVLPGESAEDFDTLLREFNAELNPIGHAERAAVAQMADCTWRMHRVSVLEASLFSDIPADMSPTQGLLENKRFRLFAELSKQLGRLDRSYHAARKALAELQTERRNVEAVRAQVKPVQQYPVVLASFPPVPIAAAAAARSTNEYSPQPESLL